MKRIKFLKVLLPVLLVVFLVALTATLRPRPRAQLNAPAPRGDSQAHATEVEYVEFVGSEKKIEATIEEMEQGQDGSVRLGSIDSLKLSREGKDPLRLATDSGFIEGEPGERQMSFSEPVTIVDDHDDLVLKIPNLRVDQAEGRADSPDAFEFRSPDFSGRGSKLVYGLKGQPTELYDLFMEDNEGATLAASKGLLHDGFSNVEFIDGVQLIRGDERFRSEWLEVRRSPTGEPERAVARGGTSGTVALAQSGLADFEGQRMVTEWDAAGKPRRWLLNENARISRGEELLSAASIEAERQTGPIEVWNVHADGPVSLRGMFGNEPAWLRTARLDAVFDEGFVLLSIEATGRVSFDGSLTRAEAERAEYSVEVGRIRLQGTSERKARLARAQIRIAAEEILTDPRGHRLDARRRVEATLLAANNDASGNPASVAGDVLPMGALFDTTQAVHFVSEELEGRDAGARLTFSGGVRGWQGDRNLASDRIVLDQNERSLLAEGNVTTRAPRETTRPGVSEGDFVQIRSDRLYYAEASGLAVYERGVRVRLAEGWIEAGRLEVELSADNDIREIRAFDAVQLEFREPVVDGAPRLMTGLADRMTYRPLDATITLYGDQAPAWVQRVGEGRGKTSGRELSYRLDVGTLAVVSGDEGPAKIRTSN